MVSLTCETWRWSPFFLFYLGEVDGLRTWVKQGTGHGMFGKKSNCVLDGGNFFLSVSVMRILPLERLNTIVDKGWESIVKASQL